MRKKLSKFSENYHMFIHILLGIVIGVWLELTAVQIVTLGMLAMLPDLEHIVFFLTYGKKTKYAKKEKYYLLKGDIKGLVNFCKKNHKFNTSLYFHNAIVPILLIWGSINFIDNHWVSAILATLASHYIFDIVEDLLILGKINSNWFLKFNR
jgi:hypothetical protein